MNEEFVGSIEVEYEGMPSIMLESYKSRGDGKMAQRLSAATRRRKFTLRKDWEIELGDIGYSGRLNGTVKIPARGDNARSIVFDGASIPFPWLASVLTIGILRPLGVMLVGSIVHDYAYKYGSLLVSRNGSEFEAVHLSRDEADRLFRDIVGTVNKLPLVGYVAWFAVRIGWLWVRYNGKPFGGKAPFVEYALLLVALLVSVYLFDRFSPVVLGCIGIGIYALLYSASIIINYFNRPQKE